MVLTIGIGLLCGSIGFLIGWAWASADCSAEAYAKDAALEASLRLNGFLLHQVKGLDELARVALKSEKPQAPFIQDTERLIDRLHGDAGIERE